MEAGLALLCLVFFLLLVIPTIIGFWKIFVKAGEPGWAILIPIYNQLTILKIVGRPWWWILIGLIPFVGPIISLICNIIVCLDLARCFGKSSGFGVGLILLPFIFIPILGFGDAYYGSDGSYISRKKKKKKKKKQDRDWDDEDDYPKKKKKYDDDFEDDFDDDFEEDRPKSRKRYADEDDDFDDEPPPKKKNEGVKSITRRKEEDEDFEDEEPPPPPRKKEQVQAKLPPSAPGTQGAKVVACPQCQKKLKAPTTMLGKKVKCPGCGEPFVAS